jgi:aquaporin related protein
MDIYPSSSRDSASTTSDSGRNILTATLAEFVGTFMFLLLALSATQVSNLTWSHSFQDPNLTALIFTSLAFAASFTANLWVFYRVSAACFNPVVS